MNDPLDDILETKTPERWATGFEFTEGPLWDPRGHFYFVDIRANLDPPAGEPPEKFAAHIKAERESLRRVIEITGLKEQ